MIHKQQDSPQLDAASSLHCKLFMAYPPPPPLPNIGGHDLFLLVAPQDPGSVLEVKAFIGVNRIVGLSGKM